MKVILVLFSLSLWILNVVSQDNIEKVDCFDEDKMKAKGEEMRNASKECWEKSNGDHQQHRSCMREKFGDPSDRTEFNFQDFLAKKLEDFKAAKEQIETAATECWNNQKDKETDTTDSYNAFRQGRNAMRCFFRAVRQYCNKPPFGPGGFGGPRGPVGPGGPGGPGGPRGPGGPGGPPPPPEDE